MRRVILVPRAPRSCALSIAALSIAVALALGAAGCNADVNAPVDTIDAGRPLTSPADLAAALPDLLVPDDAAEPDGSDVVDPRRGPPYPIVLVHGMAGFRKVGPLEYFYGVADALRKDGHDVWVSQQDPLNNSEIRGEQVRKFVIQVLERTGKDKVNLVGHSQGGFDSRYVASLMGKRVASVTTIASPMLGSPVADVALGIIPGPLQSALGALLDLYGAIFGYDSNVKSQLQNITTQGAAAFFLRYPDHPQVAYFSIAGRSAMATGDIDCQTSTPALFVSRWNQDLDPLNPVFAVTAGILDAQKPRPTHDGMVTVSSARHGRFLGCIPADHMDEIGLLPGNNPGAGNRFDHIVFYRGLADWLVDQGY